MPHLQPMFFLWVRDSCPLKATLPPFLPEEGVFGNIGVQCGLSGEGLGEEEGSHQEGPTGWPQHSATQKPTGMFEEGSDPIRLRVRMITLASEGRKARGEVRPVVGGEGRGLCSGPAVDGSSPA